MPYIKKENRPPYIGIIEAVLEGIPRYSDNVLKQADYIGYFTFGVVRGFYNPQYYVTDTNIFGYTCGNPDGRQMLNDLIRQALGLLSSKDIMERGGEFNYLISAVIWGFLGDSINFKSARYATRAYMRGILLRIKDQVEKYSPYGEEECCFYTLLRGSLGDIMDEIYRRRTAAYEEQQIKASGDVWPLRTT